MLQQYENNPTLIPSSLYVRTPNVGPVVVTMSLVRYDPNTRSTYDRNAAIQEAPLRVLVAPALNE